ncbi:hypothetical protein SAMN05192568_106818 [Methylobacterium pseudosasicola]|uniref:Uncharacterized protein n=1 Tax=Methylobacterium pseudosasicola TaxID=582667 RepID=A0A1I4UE71_9HYPH|nr:hypothetical protein SAMN05192568_106818 [Methylobacterium pseudosasicola]
MSSHGVCPDAGAGRAHVRWPAVLGPARAGRGPAGDVSDAWRMSARVASPEPGPGRGGPWNAPSHPRTPDRAGEDRRIPLLRRAQGDEADFMPADGRYFRRLRSTPFRSPPPRREHYGGRNRVPSAWVGALRRTLPDEVFHAGRGRSRPRLSATSPIHDGRRSRIDGEDRGPSDTHMPTCEQKRILRFCFFCWADERWARERVHRPSPLERR